MISALTLPLTFLSLLQPPALSKEEEMKECTSGAQLRLMLWLGLEKDQREWTQHAPGGKLATFAETVSTQVFIVL